MRFGGRVGKATVKKVKWGEIRKDVDQKMRRRNEKKICLGSGTFALLKMVGH